jgi:hypothetical protein
MVEITREEFENIPVEKLKGVFVFTNKNECPLCGKYLESLKIYNTSDWMLVNISTKDDKRWATINMMINGFPCTRVLYKDLTLYDRGGILFDKQIKSVFEVLYEHIPELEEMDYKGEND